MPFQKGDLVTPKGQPYTSHSVPMHVDAVDDYADVVCSWLDEREALRFDIFSSACLDYHEADKGYRRRAMLHTMTPDDIAHALRTYRITFEDVARALEDREIRIVAG